MICACIDIGSNTTRLLVAEAGDGQLRELVTQRAFTRIGKSLASTGSIPAEKIAETAEVVATQAKVARDVGAEQLVAVATAAIRNAPNRDELIGAVEASGGVPLGVLSGEEEARLSFVGATRTMLQPADGTIAVIDVGGGSSEIAVGEADGRSTGRARSESARASWRTRTCAATRRRQASWRRSAATWRAPSRASSRRPPRRRWRSAAPRRRCGACSGAELSHETLERGIRVLCTTPIDEVAARFELDVERVRLLPAGILVLEAISDLLELPLRIARGGLREGVLLELVEGRRLA